MREIKFRAYIKKDYNKELVGKIVKVSSLHLNTQKAIIGYSLKQWSYGNKSFKFEDIELMQYTGLRDKNGKEIYDGDIVIMHYFFENHGPDLGVFEDEAEITGTVYINEYHTFVKAKNGDVYSFLDYIQEPSEELEVIGNIYDNPELLG